MQKNRPRLEQMKEEKALLQREEEERRKVSQIRTSAKFVFTCSGGSRILSVEGAPTPQGGAKIRVCQGFPKTA